MIVRNCLLRSQQFGTLNHPVPGILEREKLNRGSSITQSSENNLWLLTISEEDLSNNKTRSRSPVHFHSSVNPQNPLGSYVPWWNEKLPPVQHSMTGWNLMIEQGTKESAFCWEEVWWLTLKLFFWPKACFSVLLRHGKLQKKTDRGALKFLHCGIYLVDSAYSNI